MDVNSLNESTIEIIWKPPHTLVGTDIHGYFVTVHSSDGETPRRVFVNGTSLVHKFFHRRDVFWDYVFVTVFGYNGVNGRNKTVIGIHQAEKRNGDEKTLPKDLCGTDTSVVLVHDRFHLKGKETKGKNDDDDSNKGTCDVPAKTDGKECDRNVNLKTNPIETESSPMRSMTAMMTIAMILVVAFLLVLFVLLKKRRKYKCHFQ